MLLVLLSTLLSRPVGGCMPACGICGHYAALGFLPGGVARMCVGVRLTELGPVPFPAPG